MYFYVDFKIVLDFPLLSHYYGGSFSLKMVFLLVGSSFSVAFVGGVLCVYLYIYYARLWFCLFWVCWVSGEFLLAGRVIFSFCVGLRCLECRAGTIYLSASLGWVAGLYRFSSFGLCCGEYGTIYLSAGRKWAAGLYIFFLLVLFVSLVFLSC